MMELFSASRWTLTANNLSHSSFEQYHDMSKSAFSLLFRHILFHSCLYIVQLLKQALRFSLEGLQRKCMSNIRFINIALASVFPWLRCILLSCPCANSSQIHRQPTESCIASAEGVYMSAPSKRFLCALSRFCGTGYTIPAVCITSESLSVYPASFFSPLAVIR